MENNSVPCLEPQRAEAVFPGPLFSFGHLGGIPCYCGDLDDEAPLAPEFSRVGLRAFFHGAEDPLRQAAGYGRQIMDLHVNASHCGRCGSPTRPARREHARQCRSCGYRRYPRISPAVIMAVTREDKILLARGVNFPNKQMFSVLAGFVSPSETLEDCVKREVFEETGIRVNRVRYVASQPWPFPDSLMIGFTACCEGGNIRIDPEEIAEAGWFGPDELPLIPDAYTLAGQLIRDFVRKTEG